MSELEVRVKDLEKKNSEIEERLSTLQNENQMLRHVRLPNFRCRSHLNIMTLDVLHTLNRCYADLEEHYGWHARKEIELGLDASKY